MNLQGAYLVYTYTLDFTCYVSLSYYFEKDLNLF